VQLVRKEVVLVPEPKVNFPGGISEGFFGASVAAFMWFLLRSDIGEKGTSGVFQST